MNVDFKQDSTTWRILIDGLPHLYVIKETFNGFRSYFDIECYYIEIYIKDGSMWTLYETEDVWKEILKLLNENL